MHQLDPLLQQLDVELENASAGDDAEVPPTDCTPRAVYTW